MPLREDLLVPIPGDNPSGPNLYNSPVFEQIRDARKQEYGGSQGLWAEDTKTADYARVFNLAGETLATKTKDLHLATWLAEAALYREGFGTFKATLDVIRGLVETFWDTLHPELEDGEAEFRSAPLEWLGNYLDPAKGSSPALACKMVPLFHGGFNWFQYTDSRTVAYEEACKDDKQKKARADELKAGRTAPEEIDAAFTETAKPFYKALVKDINGCLESQKTLDTLCTEKFGEFAPSFNRIRQTLEEVRATAVQLLNKKLELEPDPPEEVEEAQQEQAAEAEAAGGGPMVLNTPQDAVRSILEAARFFRTKEPQNPLSYLVVRALRWGELRAGGDGPRATLMDPAPMEMRTRIKRMALDGNWSGVLEYAESAAAAPAGRAWLDAQRYAVKACEQLGDEYRPVAAAIRAELQTLLRQFPELPEMCLMDDTPTANSETQAWLNQEVVDAGERMMLTPIPGDEPHDEPAALEAASAAAREGRPGEAVELLSRQLSSRSSGRARFLLRVQICQILMASGNQSVALPVLQQLAQEVEQRKLDEWEEPELIAQVLALLHAAMVKLNMDAGPRKALYERICRLDPAQALNCKE